VSRERVITFRGEDHTLCITDAEGNWVVYRGGDRHEVSDLTEEEIDWINNYVHDWRTD
jgi:hypothetical protein